MPPRDERKGRRGWENFSVLCARLRSWPARATKTFVGRKFFYHSNVPSNVRPTATHDRSTFPNHANVFTIKVFLTHTLRVPPQSSFQFVMHKARAFQDKHTTVPICRSVCETLPLKHNQSKRMADSNNCHRPLIIRVFLQENLFSW